MALCILHDGCRTIEPHRLVVEQGRGECRQIMTLEISAGVSNQRKAGGVRFRKSIQRKGSDGKDDLLLRLRRDAVALHAFAQLHFDIAHAPLAAFEAERPPQFLRLAAAESRGNHRHAQQLLLEKRHAQCARQYRLKRGMRIDNSLSPLPPH